MIDMLKNTILFFTRNKLKVLFLIFIISIAVLSGIITGGIFKSFADTKQKVRLVNENIMNVKIFSNDVKAFENFLYDLKEKHFEDIKIYKFKAINLSYKYFRSSEGTFQAFVSNKRGVEQFLEEIGLELIEGTIFDNGNLIASKSFLDSHGIRLGDIYKSDSEYFYNEELKISGVLYNSSIIAFIDEDYVDEKETYTSFLIKGNEIQFKAIEKSIRSSEFFNNNIFINTPNSIRNDFYKKYFSYISQN